MTCPGVNRTNPHWPPNYTSYPPYRPHGGGGGHNGKPTVDPHDIRDPNEDPKPEDTKPEDHKPSNGSGRTDVISRAIENIKNSGFAKTQLGRKITEILIRMNEAHQIYFENLGGNTVGMGGDGRIRVDDDYRGGARKGYLEEILVHEATHELQRINGTPANEEEPAETERLLHRYI